MLIAPDYCLASREAGLKPEGQSLGQHPFTLFLTICYCEHAVQPLSPLRVLPPLPEWFVRGSPLLPGMASSDPGELRPPSLPISTTPRVQNKFSFLFTSLLYTNHVLVRPPELNGMGAQATSPISPRKCWWESSLHGQQVKALHQKSKSSRREAIRERGRSEGVWVKTGSELHLEKAKAAGERQ